jgi:hypothetical protein
MTEDDDSQDSSFELDDHHSSESPSSSGSPAPTPSSPEPEHPTEDDLIEARGELAALVEDPDQALTSDDPYDSEDPVPGTELEKSQARARTRTSSKKKSHHKSTTTSSSSSAHKLKSRQGASGPQQQGSLSTHEPDVFDSDLITLMSLSADRAAAVEAAATSSSSSSAAAGASASPILPYPTHIDVFREARSMGATSSLIHSRTVMWASVLWFVCRLRHMRLPQLDWLEAPQDLVLLLSGADSTEEMAAQSQLRRFFHWLLTVWATRQEEYAK